MKRRDKPGKRYFLFAIAAAGAFGRAPRAYGAQNKRDGFGRAAALVTPGRVSGRSIAAATERRENEIQKGRLICVEKRHGYVGEMPEAEEICL